MPELVYSVASVLQLKMPNKFKNCLQYIQYINKKEKILSRQLKISSGNEQRLRQPTNKFRPS